MSFDADGPYIAYNGGATFIRRCSKCNRFVRADRRVFVNEETGLKKAPNATCRRCGRVEMVFIGFY